MYAVEQVLGFCFFPRGQYGEACVFALTLCRYDLSRAVLFILNWARVCLESVSSRRMCLTYMLS